MRRACCSALAVLAVSWLPCTAFAQVPAGAEFRANTYTTSRQIGANIASHDRYGFVIVWHSLGQDGSSYGVFGRRYDVGGVPVGAEFAVPVVTTGAQSAAQPAIDRNGTFMVVWQDASADGSGDGVSGRLFDPSGAPRGASFAVNTSTSGDQALPAIAALNPGFVVVWSNYGATPSQVNGQLFDASGARVGAEFRVDGATTDSASLPAVAADAAGNFVVAWNSDGPQNNDTYVRAQRFDRNGLRQGAELQVSTFTMFNPAFPSVARAAGGSFVVAWRKHVAIPPIGVVTGRIFDAAGGPVSPELVVSTPANDNQGRPSVATDAAGNFTVHWVRGYLGTTDIFGRRFAADGAPRGDAFRVNTYTTAGQNSFSHRALASDGAGNLVSVWHSEDQDGSQEGVFAQRYGGLLPAALSVDAPGNSVFEPGETAQVAPSWRNVNGAAQTFDGTVTSFTGPGTATYTITDGTGDYGTLANGASQACIDCYGVSVSNPPMRPTTHWDAVATERLAPDAQGQQKPWSLHVGDSFTDVPRASGFYRFVEALLHHGLTGGCTATTYCPAVSLTREQMAVFVLAAKEGAGFVPPACATPVFADVPASSVFCRWVEELARRGVTGGCAPSLFCPTAAVAREQMAVFLLRTLDPALTPPACAPPNMFNDVPETSAFCPWIEELARRGITGGCAPSLFCPTAAVTREQMAVFLTVTFGLTLYGP